MWLIFKLVLDDFFTYMIGFFYIFDCHQFRLHRWRQIFFGINIGDIKTSHLFAHFRLRIFIPGHINFLQDRVFAAHLRIIIFNNFSSGRLKILKCWRSGGIASIGIINILQPELKNGDKISIFYTNFDQKFRFRNIGIGEIFHQSA